MRKRCSKRNGTTVVECALVLSSLVVILFFLLDFGLAACRYNVLRAAADILAREAITHGKAAVPEKSQWGPGVFSSNGADPAESATCIAKLVPTMAPQDVAIEITWMDNDTRVGDRVRVELAYVHRPIVPIPGLDNGYELRATTTMRISH